MLKQFQTVFFMLEHFPLSLLYKGISAKTITIVPIFISLHKSPLAGEKKKKERVTHSSIKRNKEKFAKPSLSKNLTLSLSYCP